MTTDMTNKMGLKEVKYEKKGMIGYVALNTGDRFNTYTNNTLMELQKVWMDYNDDSDLRVAILYGAGDNFCGGHNLRATESLASEPAAIHYGDFKLYKPTIAAVAGYALGGGCSQALGCDMMILADNAKIGYPQAKHGIISIGGPQRLPRLIPGMAQWYLFSGEFITATEAYRLGMCIKVVPAASLLEEATKIAEVLCESSPDSIKTLKESIETGKMLPINEAFKASKQIAARFESSAVYQDNLNAFREKRTPAFKPKKG